MYFVDVDGLFNVCKIVELHHKIKSVTSLKNLDRVYNDIKN
jgi:hypothetical protein